MCDLICASQNMGNVTYACLAILPSSHALIYTLTRQGCVPLDQHVGRDQNAHLNGKFAVVLYLLCGACAQVLHVRQAQQHLILRILSLHPI